MVVLWEGRWLWFFGSSWCVRQSSLVSQCERWLVAGILERCWKVKKRNTLRLCTCLQIHVYNVELRAENRGSARISTSWVNLLHCHLSTKLRVGVSGFVRRDDIGQRAAFDAVDYLLERSPCPLFLICLVLCYQNLTIGPWELLARCYKDQDNFDNIILLSLLCFGSHSGGILFWRQHLSRITP
jgi:hypothetical protein